MLDLATWIMFVIMYQSQWFAEGYQYQLSGPNAGMVCKPNDPSDCRFVLNKVAPERPPARTVVSR